MQDAEKDTEAMERLMALLSSSVSMPARTECLRTGVLENNQRTQGNEEARRRQVQRNENSLQNQYMSQHCHSGDTELYEANQVLDAMWNRGILTAKVAPSYKSGKNPNYYEEYISSIASADRTNTVECKNIVWNEYENRRWSYCQHLSGYHNRSTQQRNRQLGTVELWRRFHLRQPPTPIIQAWYFDKDRKVGDIETVLPRNTPHTEGVSDFIYSSFSNCPVSPRQNCLQSVHVAVGFVDLGLLLDSQIEHQEEDTCLLFHGFEASAFAVAKFLIVWEMMKSSGLKASWVVQVWFSTIWSKRATNEFLAAARRVANSGMIDTKHHPQKVRELVDHWSRSKGVGLKKIVKRRAALSKESSDALFFAKKEDRVEMIQYHLTGAFGLLGEEPCSASILIFDCPPGTMKHEAASVFKTLTIKDVVSSEHWNGSYVQTAEKVKESRMLALMANAQSGRTKVKLSVAVLGLNSPAVEEIVKFKPRSISWSNILDYMSPKEFHAVAKACSSTAVHSGYSMNWPSVVFGASLIDYPETALKVIREAEVETTAALKALCSSRRIFLTPIQHNPLNITAGLLAKRCHSYWVRYYFEQHNAKVLEAGMLEYPPNHLGNALPAVACSWTYDQMSEG